MTEYFNGVMKKAQSLYFNTEGLSFFLWEFLSVINLDFTYAIPITEINEDLFEVSEYYHTSCHQFMKSLEKSSLHNLYVFKPFYYC